MDKQDRVDRWIDEHHAPLMEHIPHYMWGGIGRYVLFGIAPGDFLTAVINNDLKEAVGRADLANQATLAGYVKFFFNHVPSNCWGYPGAVKDWQEWVAEQAEPDHGADEVDETPYDATLMDPEANR
jgi:hypothetical protein